MLLRRLKELFCYFAPCIGLSRYSSVCRTFMSFTTLALLVISPELFQVAEASGQFQTQILSVEKIRSDGADSVCCGSSPDPTASSVLASSLAVPANTATGTNETCSGICRPYVRLCFKEYQRNVHLNGKCSYGEGFSPVLSLPFVDSNTTNPFVAINLPFNFAWMKSYTLVLELLNAQGAQADRTVDLLLEQGVQSNEIGPTDGWRVYVHEGKRGKITYRVRVVCDEYYGNATCSAYCKPRDDKFGHWYCTADAKRVCLDGWKGPQCEAPICSSTCQNGTCTVPGECRCRHGWKGVDCNQCIPHVACKHGTCQSKPWECVCQKGWGGPMCDRDLNYCGNHQPCYNYAVCHNTADSSGYECRCPPGFGGKDCNQITDPCSDFDCQNGACFNNNGTAQCRCPLGWVGERCEKNVDECASAPCANGGTCVDEIGFSRCLCPDGFYGPECKEDLTSLFLEPSFTPPEVSTTPPPVMNRTANVTGSHHRAHDIEAQDPSHPEDASLKTDNDHTTVVITVTVSVILVLAVLCFVLLALFFYRRRQKQRRSLEEGMEDDKYGTTKTNNQQVSKDLAYKDSEAIAVRSNHENEARLKILNNIFTESRGSIDGSLSDRSDSSHDSLRKLHYAKEDARSETPGQPSVRYISEPPHAHIHDPYWNNRDRPTLFVNKDMKNYMESLRIAKSQENLKAQPPPSLQGKYASEDFTVV
ncbi:hypothetical protein RvY_09500 [Ramazzottius varieornatus]|uniref:Delta-like protein n=1 Tax=Ramazzottius varieornatus TaxID=947166 RepID=A0A1D1V9H5_RAMVA|nr:hypothetical protein RvY_09500 [Ramazzottius varieornatus]